MTTTGKIVAVNGNMITVAFDGAVAQNEVGTGKIVAVNGNMITVAFDGAVAQNEVGYAVCGDKKLMAEIVRVRGTRCDMQVFDATTDLMVDDRVEFTGELLAAELGPGMLAQVYDGLQNPLADLAKEASKISKDAEFFLQRGMYLSGLPRDRKWDFHPIAKVGDRVTAGDFLGWVTKMSRRYTNSYASFPFSPPLYGLLRGVY